MYVLKRIATMNPTPNIRGEITESSALASCANWRSRLILHLSNRTKNLFRRRQIQLFSISRGAEVISFPPAGEVLTESTQ